MGAVSFSLDRRLVQAFKAALPLTTFVETGTFRGDATEAVQDLFAEVHTIELSHELWSSARDRLGRLAHVAVLEGDSRARLGELAPRLKERSVLYWLDAHWCVARGTAGLSSQCPLLGELEQIGRLGANSVILIDDARLFMAVPPEPHETSQWPRFQEVIDHLRRTSATHELAVVNDVICFFPPDAGAALRAYCRECGWDWLSVADQYRRVRAAGLPSGGEATHASSADGELIAKEAVITELSAEIARLRDLVADHAARAEQLAAQERRIRSDHERVERLAEALVEATRFVDAIGSPPSQRPGLVDLHRQLEDKEAVIQQQAAALKAYRSAFGVVGAPLRRVMGVRNRIRAIFRPRLGNLYQYTPRPLRVPAHYSGARLPAQPPKISIVTPSYAQGPYIERTLCSVLDQSYPHLELFVQDGGSQDGTVDVLKRYEGRLAGWESVRDNGQSDAINRGFARATGDLMAWLNSDDLLLPGALAVVAGYFEAHPDIDVVYGDRLLIDCEDREIGRWVLPRHDDRVLDWADFVPQETLFWRRSIWERAGARIDDSFRFAMDWELLMRFRAAGARFAHIRRFLGAFRVHPQQKTSAAINEIGFKEMSMIREKALGRIPTHHEIRRAIVPYMLRHLASDMAFRVRSRLGRA